MFGIGISELVVIFLVALLVLGPDQLPKVARKLAQFFGEFRKLNEDLRLNLMSASNDIIATQEKAPKNAVARGQIIETKVLEIIAESKDHPNEGNNLHG